MNLKLACPLGLALSMVLMPIAQAGAESKNLDKVFAGIARCRVDHVYWRADRSSEGLQASVVNALFDAPSDVTLLEADAVAVIRNVGKFRGLRVAKVFVPTRAPRDDHMQWGIEFDEPFERVNRRLASKKIVPYPDAAIAPQAYKDGKRPWLMVNTASGKPLLVCDKTAKG